MTPRSVVQYPDARLRTVAVTVRDFASADFQALLREMVAAMRRARGIGLAAPQIGVPLAVAVIEMKDGPLVMANPVISKASRRREEDEEGCLSVVRVFGTVPRARSLHLRAQDDNGRPFALDAHGLLARVIQHEYDHLQGSLFVDRCTKITAGIERARALGLTIPA